ncbi:hypothetical protein BDZ91DRAFT_767104 [Kalaharituber pfeilii]|nr:hypothetical protein BDZ91DRAFT_767104 [Kalaharituber pfeilii]
MGRKRLIRTSLLKARAWGSLLHLGAGQQGSKGIVSRDLLQISVFYTRYAYEVNKMSFANAFFQSVLVLDKAEPMQRRLTPSLISSRARLFPCPDTCTNNCNNSRYLRHLPEPKFMLLTFYAVYAVFAASKISRPLQLDQEHSADIASGAHSNGDYDGQILSQPEATANKLKSSRMSRLQSSVLASIWGLLRYIPTITTMGTQLSSWPVERKTQEKGHPQIHGRK